MTTVNIDPHRLLMRGTSVNTYCKSVFDKCDKDQDGFVSLEELTAFIKSNEQTTPTSGPLTPIIINNYQRFDQNHDNKLDFEEFVAMITNDSFLRDFANLGNRYVKFLVPVSRRTVKLRRMHTITVQIALFYLDVSEPLIFDQSKRYQIWRYMTYMFTHSSSLHLFNNVIFQLAIGLPLEMVHGWRVLVIYCAGVLGGSLFQSVIYPRDNLTGGSPGVYSFFTAHIATVIMNWREISQPVAQLILFGFFTVCDPVYKYITYRNDRNVSYISHLGGAICGLLVGVNILRNLRETRGEKIIWWISVVLYTALMVTLISLEITVNFMQLKLLS
ncbi:hypothetical protein GWI33_014788 [Rhynchophorus ferrugineus]|uniref:EF-hand domain-containing protein n=1 Tax=Rhynchophorus ferrugineus TaxID=354439 RepID=A0A834I4H4_RHYFE|nr:hypothetical protein GWI33_014788 [Rhynchophorus ferrugineus]